MRHMRVMAGVGLLLGSGGAFAACPPMSAYEVTGVSATNVPMADALGLLFAGTPWKVDVQGDANGVRLSYRDVSGPMDRVLARAVSQAGGASGVPVAAVTDPQRCVVTVSAKVPPPPSASQPGVPVALAAAPAPAPVVRPVERAVIHAGETLSEGLAKFAAKSGWTMRWNIDQDYVLDVDLTLPDTDVIDAVTWVVRTYQQQGGLEGVVPRFAKGNKVVVIEDMNVREQG